MGVPLSVMRGQRRPGRKWTDTDRVLALALQAYEDDLCQCGQPRTYAYDSDAARRYKAHETTCHACAALDRASGGEQRPRPGVRRYVTPEAGLEHAMRHPIHVPPFPRD